MNNITKITTGLAAIAGLALAVSSTHAATVFTTASSIGDDTITDELAFAGDVSSTDLLTGKTGTVGGTFAGGTVANLNNGAGRTIDSTVNIGGGVGEIAWVGNSGSSIEFVIGAGDGSGYDISGVTSFADWSDSGFVNQKYDIYLRELGGSYALYNTVDYQPAADFVTGGATKVNVTDDLGLLGSGIDAIRFDFLETVSQPNGGTVFSEIDVFGSATVVPEPSTSALLGGLLALGAVMTRRRSA